jgi:hypothetical protein
VACRHFGLTLVFTLPIFGQTKEERSLVMLRIVELASCACASVSCDYALYGEEAT